MTDLCKFRNLHSIEQQKKIIVYGKKTNTVDVHADKLWALEEIL